MKKFTLPCLTVFILILASAPTAKAQTNEFAPIGAKWHYDASPGFHMTQLYTTIESVKDTVVQGKTCRVLKQLYYERKNILSNDPERNYIIYSDNGIVYQWRDSIFTTLMNFNLGAGQSWQYIDKDGVKIQFTVESTDTITVEGKKLKVLKMKNIGHYFDNVIENIGSTYAFVPTYDLYESRVRTERLRCYQDSAIFYQYDEEISCDTIFEGTSVPELARNNTLISINPNPFKDNFNISIKGAMLGTNNKYDVSLFSMDGKKITGQSFYNADIYFQVPAVPMGLYLLRIQSGNETTFKKVIKQ